MITRLMLPGLSKSLGFSLIELLIALSLSAMLILGVSKIYLCIKSSFNRQNSIITLQENGQFIVSYLDTIIENAGNSDCVDDTHLLPTEKIQGYRSEKTNSDVLVVNECYTYDDQIQYLALTYYISQGGLYEKPGDGNARELVHGITEWQLSYGISDGHDIAYYQSADQVSDWSMVRAVKLSYLLESRWWQDYASIKKI